MKELEFKIGDRVYLDTAGAYENVDGHVGTVISFSAGDYDYGIECDDYVGMHDCGGKGEGGHCIWVYQDWVAPEVEVDYSPLTSIEALYA